MLTVDVVQLGSDFHNHGENIRDICSATSLSQYIRKCCNASDKSGLFHQTQLVLVLVAFFLICKDLGRLFNHSFPYCPFFFFFFLKWRFAHAHLFHSLGQNQSTSVAQQAETTGRLFPDKLRVNLFLDRFPHYVWTAFSQPTLIWLGHVCLGVSCLLRFWQNDQGLLHATAVTRGCNGHKVKVSTES